jgi:hypothetical protein
MLSCLTLSAMNVKVFTYLLYQIFVTPCQGMVPWCQSSRWREWESRVTSCSRPASKQLHWFGALEWWPFLPFG